MKQRDNPNFPRADRDGLYGCCRCGGYARVKAGERLTCSCCKSPKPLVRVGDILAPVPKRKDRREDHPNTLS